MYNSGQADFGELSAVVSALAENEITLCEFQHALRRLPGEALQVVATMLGCRAALLSIPSDRIRAGRLLCASGAARLRHAN